MDNFDCNLPTIMNNRDSSLVIAMNVKVYWTLDNEFYEAKIISRKDNTTVFAICCTHGKKETIDVSNEMFEALDENTLELKNRCSIYQCTINTKNKRTCDGKFPSSERPKKPKAIKHLKSIKLRDAEIRIKILKEFLDVKMINQWHTKCRKQASATTTTTAAVKEKDDDHDDDLFFDNDMKPASAATNATDAEEKDNGDDDLLSWNAENPVEHDEDELHHRVNEAINFLKKNLNHQ